MAIRNIFIALLMLFGPVDYVFAEQGFAAVTMTPVAGGGETYTLSMQVLALMTALSLLPAALITMTSFTRIIIVLAILRQALGTAQTPSNQILIGLALFLSLFIMAPVFQQMYESGIQPYMAEEIDSEQALASRCQIRCAALCSSKRGSLIWVCLQTSGITARNRLTAPRLCHLPCWCLPI